VPTATGVAAHRGIAAHHGVTTVSGGFGWFPGGFDGVFYHSGVTYEKLLETRGSKG